MPKQIGLIAVIETGAAQMSCNFLTETKQIDRAKVRAAIRARYAGKAEFINRYQGEPRRYWAKAIARRIIRETISAARSEFHNEVVMPEFENREKFTKTEAAAVAIAESRMRCAPINGWGNTLYAEAAGDAALIREAAYARTLDAVRRAIAA